MIAKRRRFTRPAPSSTSQRRRRRNRARRARFERLEERTVLTGGHCLELNAVEFCSDVPPIDDEDSFTFIGSDIQIGYAADDPADFRPVYEIDGYVRSYAAAPNFFLLSGDLATVATADDQPIPVWSSDVAALVDVFDFLGSGARLSGAEQVHLAGVPLQVESVGLANVAGEPVAAMRGELQLDLGESTALSVDVDETTFLYVGDNDVQLAEDITLPEVTVSLFGLEVDLDSVGASYDSSQRLFEMYGQVTLSVGDPDGGDTDTLSAALGDESDPGLIVSQGQLEQLVFSISGSFEIGTLQFEAEDVGLSYVASGNQYALFGTATLELTEKISGEASLGDASDPGITITNGDWDLDNFAATISHIPLGAFAVNNLSINYSEDNGVSSFGGSVTMLFPGGWSVTGCLEFTGGELSDIAFDLELGDIEIPIGPTGLFLTGIGAGVQNLDDPANLAVEGDLFMDYGGQISVTVGGEERDVSILKFGGDFFVDAEQLVLQADVWVGGYQDGTEIEGLIGQGEGTLDLDWGDGEYKLDLSASLIDGTFTFDAEFALNTNGSLFIGGEAAVNVPDGVPVIGGDNLFSMDFELNYQQTGGENNGPQGVVAAWVDILGQDIGLAYNLVAYENDQDTNFELIGNQQVAILEAGGNPFLGTPYSYSMPFTLPLQGDPAASAALFSVNWPNVGGTQTFSVVLPDGTTLKPGDSTRANAY